MAFSDSKVHNDKSCSKTYLKNYETLKKRCDDLIVKLHETEFKVSTYKRGLTTVEDQLVTFRKNEVLFSEEIAVLKKEVGYKNYEISVLKTEFEKVKQEKEGIEFQIEKLDSASKSLDKLLESQITDKSKKGLGYHEFQEPEFEGYGPKTSKSASEDISNEVRKSNDAPLVEKLVSDDKSEKKTVFPTVAKIEFVKSKQQEKPVRKPVKYTKMYRQVNTARPKAVVNAYRMNRVNAGNPETELEDSVRLNKQL
ncbi:hypothetical protein Tco_1252462 [Tanacetum coccineum]